MKNTPNPIKMKSFTCTYYKSNTIVPWLHDRHLIYNGGKKKHIFFLLIKIFHTFFFFFYTQLFAITVQEKGTKENRHNSSIST